jgi:hypothetical protein
MERLRKYFYYLNDSFGENVDYQDLKYKELTDKIISEIKAVKNVAEEHEVQLLNYLK